MKMHDAKCKGVSLHKGHSSLPAVGMEMAKSQKYPNVKSSILMILISINTPIYTAPTSPHSPPPPPNPSLNLPLALHMQMKSPPTINTPILPSSPPLSQRRDTLWDCSYFPTSVPGWLQFSALISSQANPPIWPPYCFFFCLVGLAAQ